MEKDTLDYRFLTKTALERQEPKRRFNDESILNKVMESFPAIKKRYLNAFYAYIGQEFEPDPSPETFIKDVYNPILITSAVIEEVLKLRQPNPVAFNLDAIQVILSSIKGQSTENVDVSTQVVQKAMEEIQLSDEELFRYTVYNVCSIQLATMTQDLQYKEIIPQLRTNVHTILSSLQPTKESLQE